MMTNATTERNPAAEKLATCERPHAIEPYRLGDDELVCGRCLVGLEPWGGWWRHSIAEIIELRRAARTWPQP